MYHISKTNFHLRGLNYDLIQLIPSERDNSLTSYSVVISSKYLDQVSPAKPISDLLAFMKQYLSHEDYSNIFRVNIINSNSPFVRNLGLMFFTRKAEIFEVEPMSIGGVELDYCYLLYSYTLERLIAGHAIHLVLNDGSILPAGIISMDTSFNLTFYNGKGLREIWTIGNMNDERRRNAEILRDQPMEYLITNEYVSIINYSQINSVYKNESLTNFGAQ